MAKTTAKVGNASVEFEEDMVDFFLGAIKKVLPTAEKIMTDALIQIEEDAKKEWPKRQPRRTYNKRTKTWTIRDDSEESWKKFKRGIRVEPDGSVVVFLKNTAPYSWAIKFGVDPKNKDGRPILQPQGKRAGQELLVKPMRKSARKVIKALSEDLGRKL
jgi:1,4-alpha-glucan branching enzyme